MKKFVLMDKLSTLPANEARIRARLFGLRRKFSVPNLLVAGPLS